MFAGSDPDKLVNLREVKRAIQKMCLGFNELVKGAN
jgi:hypothetical protein